MTVFLKLHVEGKYGVISAKNFTEKAGEQWTVYISTEHIKSDGLTGVVTR